MLSAAQLLPTLELNGLGWRSEGLPFRQAVSFSLQPRLLLQSLMPPFGGGLAGAFGSEGYAEFVGYIGIAALMLAAVGAWAAWRRRKTGDSGALAALTLGLLAVIGLFLALGAYNPIYYLLWRFIPGFDLFRAPVRWLALYALGVAGLAGFGLDALAAPRGRRDTATRGRGDTSTRGRGDTATRRHGDTATRGQGERGRGANVRRWRWGLLLVVQIHPSVRNG